jgi:hypothetical protein
MDKKIAALLGAVAGLATLSSAQAATHSVPNPSEALQAASYADLLAPVPNAVALMAADDAAHAQKAGSEPLGDVQVAQHHHHHHHHHHNHHRDRHHRRLFRG